MFVRRYAFSFGCAALIVLGGCSAKPMSRHFAVQDGGGGSGGDEDAPLAADEPVRADKTTGSEVAGDVRPADASGDLAQPADTGGAAGDTLMVDVAPTGDVAQDAAPVDLAKDMSPDMVPDLAPDLAPDLTPDLAPDLPPDLSPDLAVDQPPPLLGNGSACTGASQCNSGFCTDGVCCADACQGSCYTCNGPGTAGTCAPVLAGTDPDDECLATAVAGCGYDGTCGGNGGGCRRYQDNTVCVPESCSSGFHTPEQKCSGGACQGPQGNSCMAYTCNGSTCATKCTSHADCTVNNYCEPANNNQCQDLVSGRVGYWNLDDMASPSLDSSGNNQNGTWEGAPVYDATTPVTPLFVNRGSLRFDRGHFQDRVHVARTPMLEPTGGFTITLWVYRNGNNGEGTSWITLLRKTWQNNSPPTYGSYGLQLPLNNWSMIAFSTGHMNNSNDELYSTSGALPSGVWTHVVGVLDPGGGGLPPVKRIYINGAKDNESTVVGGDVLYDLTSTGDLYFGHPGGGGGEYFNGNLDDIRIYNRALSAVEIAALAAGH